MIKVAAVCAYNKTNTGMLTVDLSLHSFLKKCFGDKKFSLTLFSVEEAYTINDELGLLSYGHLHSLNQLNSFDYILFWGDFLHSIRYHRVDLRHRVGLRNPGASPEAIDERLASLTAMLLLEGAPTTLLNRVICFGGSIYINGAVEELDARYMEAAGRLYGNAALVMLRDPVSASFASRYSQATAGNTFGIDAAFLLEPDETHFSWTRKVDQPTGARRLGVYFGRGASKNEARMELISAFVHRTGKLLDCDEIVDIDWLPIKGRNPLGQVAERLTRINSCAAIVTDTYHCAVNALREGIPAFCVGWAAEHPGGTLGEKKKELLFSMFNARNFYIFGEMLEKPDGVVEAARSVRWAYNRPEPWQAVQTAIHDSVRVAKDRLARALGSTQRI